MQKNIITHDELGIFVTGIGFQPPCFTLVPDPAFDGSDEREVHAFDSADEASAHISANFDFPGLKVEAIEVEADQNKVSFDALREAGFGRLLKDEPQPAPSM
jgi:hypothetical protein